MTLVLIVIGLFVGASVGNWSGAFLGAVGGWLAARWLKQSEVAAKATTRADTLTGQLAELRADLDSIRRRLDRLEGQTDEGAADAPPASALHADIAPKVAPPVADESTPVAALLTSNPVHVESRPAEAAAAVKESKAPESSMRDDLSPTPVEPEVIAAPPPVPDADAPPQIPSRDQPREPGFVERLLEGNIVAKIGVVILFLGVGFLLKYAYDRNLFPPELRLLAVGAAGAAMMFIGFRLLERNRTYAIILMGAAFGLFYLDTYFALKTFGLIGPATGFGLFAILGVATMLTAVRLDARALAGLGMLGAFLAPWLAATGKGNHVLLFSYFLLLNLIILTASWFKTWRELNFIGFLFTFGIALVWGYAHYVPENFATVEPFLIAYFLLYLAIPILFASRQPPQLKGLVDGTLVFGMPLSAAMMQTALTRGMPDSVLAWSAAGAAAIYGVLAWTLWKRDKMRLLAEAHLSLAVVFGTVTPYFAFRGYPTFAFWTLEGAAIYWMGCRQGRVLGRAFALCLQVLAAVYFWWVIHDTIDFESASPWNNDRVVGDLLIAGSALLTAWFMHRYRETVTALERSLEILAIGWGGLWFLYALSIGIWRQWQRGVDRYAALLVLSTAAGVAVDMIGRRLDWNRLRLIARAQLPLIGLVAMAWAARLSHPLQEVGLVAWPTAFVGYFLVLHRQRADGIEAASGWRYQLAWLVMLALASWEAAWRYDQREFLWVWGLGAAGLVAAALRFVLRESKLETPRTLWSQIPLAWSVAVWCAGLHGLIGQHGSAADEAAWHLVASAASIALFEWVGRFLDWRTLRATQGLLTLALLLVAIGLSADRSHPLAAWQWPAWGIAYATNLVILRRQEADGIAKAAGAQSVVMLDLAVALVVWELGWQADRLQLSATWKLAATGAGLALGLFFVHACARRPRWPVSAHREALVAGSVMPGLLIGAAWTLMANGTADGTVLPWPYLPVLNAFDLAQLALLAAAGATIPLLFKAEKDRRPAWAVLAALTFWWINAVLLRSVHQWTDIPFQLPDLLRSVVAQSALSLLWTSTALVIMFAAVKRAQRGLWMIGVGLLALTVAKLFLNDLAHSGTVARIVSFIGVGALVMLIGYVAPVPPRAKAAEPSLTPPDSP